MVGGVCWSLIFTPAYFKSVHNAGTCMLTTWLTLMMVTQLCGNYIFCLAQWNWLSFDHGSCPGHPFPFCFSEKYTKFPHVSKLFRSRHFGENKRTKTFLGLLFSCNKAQNSFTFQKRSEKSQSLPGKENAGNQYAWNRKILNIMAKITFAQWKLRTLHSIIYPLEKQKMIGKSSIIAWGIPILFYYFFTSQPAIIFIVHFLL